ncbi:CGNR zinc finger domain-containing protein [Nocardia callitridis]|uniref:CGNR zinc finger domain-containing protein n=1 Tax=Nocardia callitridis TaxID=648753 RepID=UPI0031EDA373
MRESHFREEALTFATDLLNNPPESPEDLAARWDRSGLSATTGTRAETRDVAEVAAFLTRWASVIDAADEGDRVARLNSLLATAAAYPRITDHDGSPWHLHYRDDRATLASIIRTVTVVAAAEHLTTFGMHRLGRCASADCGRAFVDFSRGGRQRYCTRMCANRDAVRRHRSRRARPDGGAAAVRRQSH